MPSEHSASRKVAIQQQAGVIEQPTLLIGEGDDEVSLFWAILHRLGRRDVQVEHYCGKHSLQHYLANIDKRTGFRSLTSLGIVQDADDSAERAFQSVVTSLGNAGLAIPSAPGEIADGVPRVGVFILPNGRDPGALESLVLECVRTRDEFQCVDQYFDCVQHVSVGWRQSPDKARLRVWLAAFDPYARLAKAANDVFDIDHEAFTGLKAFLQEI